MKINVRKYYFMLQDVVHTEFIDSWTREGMDMEMQRTVSVLFFNHKRKVKTDGERKQQQNQKMGKCPFSLLHRTRRTSPIGSQSD